ncbi:MAG: chemotaxis protein CheW [Epsilonproteobacteria bacterium]|nr:chemotaxis protein CheW [Campylobacterota bacterium]
MRWRESCQPQRGGEPKEGFFATLITEDMQIIASSNAAHKVGGYIDLDSRYTEMSEGESISEIVVYHDKYYPLGVKCSKDYREYKSPKDDYSQRVYSLFFSYISDVVELIHERQKPFMLERDVTAQNDASRVDVASFMIGKQWLGLEAKDVVEAVSISELKSTVKIDKDHHFKGTLIYNDAAVMVIDIKKFIQESVDEEYNEIVIIRYGSPENYLGILVNTLGDIPEVEIERIKKLQAQIIGSGTLVDCVAFPSRESSSKEVLSILSVDKIISELVKPEQAKLLPSRLRA